MDRWLHFEPMAPGEVAERFGGAFVLERIAGTARPEWWRFLPGTAAYLMVRRNHEGTS